MLYNKDSVRKGNRKKIKEEWSTLPFGFSLKADICLLTPIKYASRLVHSTYQSCLWGKRRLRREIQSESNLKELFLSCLFREKGMCFSFTDD